MTGRNTAPAPPMDVELPHVHQWQPLGFHHRPSFTLVVQSCVCGDAREVQARSVYEWNDEHPHGTDDADSH